MGRGKKQTDKQTHILILVKRPLFLINGLLLPFRSAMRCSVTEGKQERTRSRNNDVVYYFVYPDGC